MKLPDSSEGSKEEKEQPYGPLKRMNIILGAGQPDNPKGEVEPAPKKEPPKREVTKKPSGKRKAYRLEREKVRVAYWNVTGTLSLIVNVILIAALVLLSRELFFLKRLVVGNVLGGMYTDFGAMDAAHIRSNILVEDKINVNFPLLIDKQTVVTLTEDTTITGARVTVTTGGLNIISAPTNIILPAGSRLPIQLNLVVEVDQEVDVSLDVPVDIPLSETELHEPFTHLQGVVEPFVNAFWDGSFYWEQFPACQKLPKLCDWWFR
jgi:hypothetical protein